MKLKKLGKTNIQVSPIGFGVLTIGKNQLNLSLSEGADLVKYGLESGINLFDTAQYYHTYHYMKEAFKSTNLDPVIMSKSLNYSYNEMKEAVEEARIALDRDIIDIFLLHEVRHGDDFNMRQGAWEYLQEAKQKGIVKAIGISTHHVDVAENIAHVEECDVIFPLINKFGLGIRNGAEAGNANEMIEAIEENANNDKGVLAMKVFGGGNLTGKYLECMDFIKELSVVDSSVLGFGKKEEVDTAIKYIEGNLEKSYAPDISKKKITIDAGDCEGCSACFKRCPNKAISMNVYGSAEIDYHICLNCGYCAPVCPVRAIIML